MSFSEKRHNWNIEQGTTWTPVVTFLENDVAVDLTGFTARMQARIKIEDTDTPFIDLTTENGGITLGGVAGTITLFLSATATEAITEESGVYDLEIEDGSSIVTRVLEGNVIICREVTR